MSRNEICDKMGVIGAYMGGTAFLGIIFAIIIIPFILLGLWIFGALALFETIIIVYFGILAILVSGGFSLNIWAIILTDWNYELKGDK